MKNILLSAVTLFMLATSITSQAGGGTTNGTDTGTTAGFIGLWEGVDPEDGAHNILSITDNGAGTVKLLQYATYFTRCNGGRGIVQGTSAISTEGTLELDDYTVTCFDPSKTETLSVTFTLNSDGTLTEDRSASESPTVIYHRTSNKM